MSTEGTAINGWSEVESAAFEWWLGKRPKSWSDSDHMRNPVVNCSTNREHALALRVALMARDGGRTGGGSDG